MKFWLFVSYVLGKIYSKLNGKLLYLYCFSLCQKTASFIHSGPVGLNTFYGLKFDAYAKWIGWNSKLVIKRFVGRGSCYSSVGQIIAESRQKSKCL